MDLEMAVILKYDAKGVSPKFWHELYGYDKGKYSYPGLLDRLSDVRKLSSSVLLVSESEIKAVKKFLDAWKVEYAVFSVTGGEKPKSKEIPPKKAPLRWDMPIEVLDERLRGLGEKMDELGPFIRTKTVRNALEDVKKYGY